MLALEFLVAIAIIAGLSYITGRAIKARSELAKERLQLERAQEEHRAQLEAIRKTEEAAAYLKEYHPDVAEEMQKQFETLKNR